MYSMTGYGKAVYSQNDIDITVEIKTVNNRYLDINSKMPRTLFPLEEQLRKIISNNVNRGRLDVYINLFDKREKEKTVIVDTGLAKGYLDAAKKLADKFNLENDFTVSRLLKTPDIVKAEDKNSFDKEYEIILTKSLKIALENLNTMRQSEGMAIKKDLESKLSNLKTYTENIKSKAPLVAKEYKNKLTEKIKEALEKVEIDQTRLLNEVAFFTDKSSIDEELTRLHSHFLQFEEIIKDKKPVGRKLDFLVQELNREANTICSKSSDTFITNNALLLKSEIEKIREQVQNIE